MRTLLLRRQAGRREQCKNSNNQSFERNDPDHDVGTPKISTKLAFGYDNENLPPRQPGAIGQPN